MYEEDFIMRQIREITAVIAKVLFGKKADFLTDEMAEKSLPLVPSMVLSLVVVII